MTALLVIIYVSFISLGLPDSVLGSVWPQMQPDLHAGVALAGYISMTITAGTVVSSILSDRLVRRFGVGRVTAVSVLMTAAALLGFALSPGVPWLFAFAVPLGLGAGSVDVALNNFVALRYEARHMSWLHCFWGIGASTGPMIAAAALRAGGSWRTGYGLIAALQGALCIALFCALPLWRRAGDSAQVSAAAAQTEPPARLPRTRGTLPLMLGFLFYCAMENTGGLWGATFIHDRYALAPSDAALTSTLYFSALTLGRIAAGFAASRWQDRRLIRIGLCISAAGLLLVLSAGQAELAMGGIFLMGFGFAPVYPAMLHATPTYFGPELSQRVMGLEMAFAYVGSTCFPPLFGALADRVGTGIYPGFLLICLLLAAMGTETVNRCFMFQRNRQT